ncbi:MAG: hypothetical protein IJ043_03225 [Clostridia bacterium]|nr:hypothetical protein [Clostridia bacterium]
MIKLLRIVSAGCLVLMALCIAGAVGSGAWVLCWGLFVIFGAVSLITGFAAK